MITIAALGGYILWRAQWSPMVTALYVAIFGWLLYLYGIHVVGAICDQKPTFTALEQWMHDNTMILSLAGMTAAHWILNSS
jgi:hypothetical protein